MVGGVWGSTSLAQTSKDYAVMGKKAYAAFECAALASFARDEDEQHRLFQLGYDEGKTFLEALRNGKIEAEDVNSTVPVGITLALEGPTADFILGRVWEGAVKNVLDKINRDFSDDHYPSSDEQAGAAKNHFSRENCGLISADPAR